MCGLRSLSLLLWILSAFTNFEECSTDENQDWNVNWNYAPTFTECGGVIPVSIVSNTRIDYKSKERLSNNEFCVWTIPLKKNIRSVNITAQYFLPGKATGLVAYTWNGIGLDSFIFPSDKTKLTLFFNTTVFLALSTDPTTTANPWDGIFITINGHGSLGGIRAEAFHLDEDEGEFRYPPKGGTSTTGFASIVVQGQTKGATQIKEIFLEDLDVGYADNYVYVYTLYMKHVLPQPFEFLGRYAGTHVGEVSSSVTTTVYPNLYIYTSSGKSGGRFGIQWRNYASKNNYGVNQTAYENI